jgi:hypothetical protein
MIWDIYVTTLALGSRPRQGLARVWAKREARECGRVWEWTFTLPSELPFWESDCRGQNPLHWRIIYIIGKLLKLKCLKWARITHLDIWNTSYGQKKGRESNWQFNFRPLKVKNRPDFLVCWWRATYCWKALNKGYNFAWDFIPIRGLHTKLWGPEVVRIPTLAILGLPFGMWASWRGAQYSIRGKVVASPKSGPWWVLWVQVCLWLVLTPKEFPQGTNQLMAWFCTGSCEWVKTCHSS